MTIIAAYQDAGTYRGAAAICGTTPKTVKRVIQRAQAGGVRPPPRDRVRNFEVVADLVAARVKKSSGRIPAKRLLPAARTAGYEGSARNFRRLVAQAKRDWRVEHHRGRRPAIWSPGEHLVIDWGTQGGVHVFCAVLAWSRWRFVRFAADEKSATTLAMLGECFAQMGGVPQVVLADRMGALKGGVVANRVIPTGEYVRFAMHYGFRADFCEAADPESKGIVENLVGYAKSDLLTPLLLDDELDPDKSNEAAKGWCGEVNAAVHSEIVAVPEQRLAPERLPLAGLPPLQLRIGPAPVMRKVDKLSCVRIGSARYSFPMILIGTIVQVVAGSGRVLIVVPHTGEVIADHAAVAPGETSVADEHCLALELRRRGRFRPEHTTAVSLLDRLLHPPPPWSPAGSPTGCARPEPPKEDPRTRPDQPQGVGTFSWPPAGTSPWPLTALPVQLSPNRHPTATSWSAAQPPFCSDMTREAESGPTVPAGGGAFSNSSGVESSLQLRASPSSGRWHVLTPASSSRLQGEPSTVLD